MVPLKFLKILLPYVDTHILHIINTIITTSVYPSVWKTARVTPIPKNGKPLTFEDLRPISILSALSKVVENIIKQQILQHIRCYSLLDNAQHGFREGLSTTTLLLEMTDKIRQNYNLNKLSVLLSVELTKVFDRVDHGLLLEKLLSKLHFSKSAFGLMKSYLSNRSQFVGVGEKCSKNVDVSSGVPQGSVLGPLLFTLFMNDGCRSLVGHNCKVLLYADDIFLLFTGERHYEDVMQANINYNIENLSRWLFSNRLQINVLKTKAMGFNLSELAPINITINSTVVKFCDHIKCLGVIIDEKLKFEEHINSISQRVNFSLRRLYSINSPLPLGVRANAANALLLSTIAYGLEVYSGTTMSNMHEVRRLVIKILRYVYKCKPHEHCTPYMLKFLGFSFETYTVARTMSMFYKTMKFHTPDQLADTFLFSKSRRNT